MYKTSLIVALGSSLSIFANTINVTAFGDEFDTPSGASVSLREALRDAESLTGTVTICIQVFETQVSAPLTIRADHPAIVITPSHPSNRITIADDFVGTSLFEVEDARFTLSGLDIDLDDEKVLLLDARGETAILSGCRVANCRVRPVFLGSGADGVIDGCEFENLIGGGVQTNGVNSLTVADSLFTSITGSAIAVGSSPSLDEVEIVNSTFAENRGLFSSSAVVSIGTSGSPDILIRNCSFVDNFSMPFTGPDSSEMDHCLFARNYESANPETPVAISVSSFFGRGVTSMGYNLADADVEVFTDPTDMDQVDPKVSRLGDFGGGMRCCFPQAGSPAIDGGNYNRPSLLPSFDVRGFDRAANFLNFTLPNTIDIGAVEVNPQGTLLVSSSSTSGAGSLAAALASATAETNYIEFTDGVAANVIRYNGEIGLSADEEVNININGAPNQRVRLSSATKNDGVLDLSADPGVEMSVSLQNITFQELAAPSLAERNQRGCLQFTGSDVRAALHDCLFVDNELSNIGAVHLVDGADLKANYCGFENNEIFSVSGGLTNGGAAVTVMDSGTASFRGCYFENNSASLGGVVDAQQSTNRFAEVSFDRCTFSGNSGSFASVGAGGVYSIDRCTFAENTGGPVLKLISASGGNNSQRVLEMNGSVFYQNENPDSAEAVELEVLSTGTSIRLVVEESLPNWTDESSSYPGLFDASGLGVGHRLGDLAAYGTASVIKTRPLEEGSFPVIAEADYLPQYVYLIDAIGEVGQDTDFVTVSGDRFSRTLPGAMQRTIPPSVVAEVEVISVTREGAEVVLEVLATEGFLWEIYGGTGLPSLFDTGESFLGSSSVQEVRFDPPGNPETYFLQIREGE